MVYEKRSGVYFVRKQCRVAIGRRRSSVPQCGDPCPLSDYHIDTTRSGFVKYCEAMLVYFRKCSEIQ